MPFTGPPRGHSTNAIATRRPRGSWVALAVVLGLLAFVLQLLATLAGYITSSVISGGIAGLCGSVPFAIVSTWYYACGPEWFRRGGAWVRLDRLTRITKTDDTVILADERYTGGVWKRFLTPGLVRFPFRHVAEEPLLYEALRDAIRTAVQQRQVEIDSAAAEAFALESSSASE